MDADWDLQLRRAKIHRLILGVLGPTRFPQHDHDDDDTSKHCKDCLVTRLHRPYIALPLWFSKNHVTEMDDLRYQTWLLGAAGRLIFFVSSSQNHGRRLWVSLTYKDHLPDWTRKSNRTTTPSSFAPNLDSMPRLVYLRRATSCPNFAFSTSSRGNLAHLRRARWHCKIACTEFRSSRFPLLSEGFRSKIKNSPSYLNRPLIHEDLFSLVENFQLPACRSKTCSRSQQCSLLTTIIGLFTTMIQPFSNLSTITKYKLPTRWINDLRYDLQ